jgi:hypothetical protein
MDGIFLGVEIPHLAKAFFFPLKDGPNPRLAFKLLRSSCCQEAQGFF